MTPEEIQDLESLRRAIRAIDSARIPTVGQIVLLAIAVALILATIILIAGARLYG